MKKISSLIPVMAVVMMVIFGACINTYAGQVIGRGSDRGNAQTETEAQNDSETVQTNNEESDSTQTTVLDPALGQDVKTLYGFYFNGAGWSDWANDNVVLGRANTYPTAFQAGLSGQPEGLSGTIWYQVNLSGSGWLDWAQNGEQTGGPEGSMPLEAIRIEFSGDLAAVCDIYTKVLVNGQWSEWAKNGETAGIEGAGTHIDAIRVSVTTKDAGEPPEAAAMRMGEIDPNRPMVALTFDDGPNAATTNRVLTALEAVGGRATFFLVGSRAGGANTATLQRMAADGNEIGNHSMNHENLTKQSSAGIQSTINQANAKIAAASGVVPDVVRPPYGAVNSSVKSTLASMGYASILWSIDTLDWKTKNAQNTVNVVLSQVRDGDIVLMHDIYSQSAEAAEILIPELVARGYQLVTVQEMAMYRGGLVPGTSYGSFR